MVISLEIALSYGSRVRFYHPRSSPLHVWVQFIDCPRVFVFRHQTRTTVRYQSDDGDLVEAQLPNPESDLNVFDPFGLLVAEKIARDCECAGCNTYVGNNIPVWSQVYDLVLPTGEGFWIPAAAKSARRETSKPVLQIIPVSNIQ